MRFISLIYRWLVWDSRECWRYLGRMENTVVLCISMDLPFAQSRFCTTEGLTRVIPLSAFRSQDFTPNYGLQIAGLLARAVIVVDEKGIVRHTQLVKEISQEPDYEAALESAATATTE